MEGPDFDDLSRRVGTSLSRRRTLWTLGGVLGGLLPALPDASVDARKKKGKKKKKGERCGPVRCSTKQFCCDDASGTCCSKKGASCCNVGPGTGTCCAGPNQCGRPIGNDAAPQECCPPERQWFTTTGLVRCCPPGKRSLGTGISSDDGPCCPEEKYCSTSPTGGRCCSDDAPICMDRSSGRCCSEADKCGTDCCGYGETCCNGKCCSFNQTCDGGVCKCAPGVRQCGDTCCHAGAVGCEGSRCLNQCDIDKNCGG